MVHGEFLQVIVWDGTILKLLAGKDKLMLTEMRNKQREKLQGIYSTRLNLTKEIPSHI